MKDSIFFLSSLILIMAVFAISAGYLGYLQREKRFNNWLNVYKTMERSGIPIESSKWYTTHHVLLAEAHVKETNYPVARRLVADAITVAQRYRGGSLGTYLPLSLREYVPKGLTLAHNRGGTVVMK